MEMTVEIRQHPLKCMDRWGRGGPGFGVFVTTGLVLMVLIYGCIEVPTSNVAYEEELAVHCLLRTDIGPSDVFVERTLNIEEPNTGIAVSGAIVRLSGDGREAILGEILGEPGRYRISAPFRIDNSSTYTLDVRDQSGRTLTATTTVPGYFQMLYPAYGDSVPKSLFLRLRWSKSEGAKEYSIHVTQGSSMTFLSYTYSDTLLYISTDELSREGQVWIDIFAVDTNYAGYTRSDPEDPDSPDINHIPGAKGVFGSAAKTFGFFYFK